jgi:hypothetical protein
MFSESHVLQIADGIGVMLRQGSAAEATGLALLRAVLPSTAGHLPFAARGITSSSARAESEKRAQRKAAENAERVGRPL